MKKAAAKIQTTATTTNTFLFTLLSMFREVVFGVGFALLLPVFFGLDGVLYSMPMSDLLTFVISAVIIVKTYRELHTEGVQEA